MKFKKLPFLYSPSEIFLRIYKCYEHAYLLESIEGPKKLAQYSFIGFAPKLRLKVKDGEIILQDIKLDEEIRIKNEDPLHIARKILGRRSPIARFRFIGGAVGYISYDAIRYWERLPDFTVDALRFPDIELGIFDDGVVFDHSRREVFYYYWNEDRFDELNKLLKEPVESEALYFTNPKVNVSKERFEESVQRAKAYIASGDIFQVVLSKRYEFVIKGDLTSFYMSLRKVNPSPYMYFLKMGDRQIVGSSPEMLFRVDNGFVETFPIAGTRPYVKNPIENEALKKELLSDPKERAEHVMLVDLARNDVGRVSEFGSVSVPEFMKVHQYSHVQHIVSRVVGKLKGGCDCFDALRAVFPAGTVSGAPKVRAMEIIEESEPTKRGPYAGAVGYFSHNGNADFAITIRTLVAKGKKCYIQVGGGIVADSVPEREWFETEHKARALLKALELCGENQQ
ncbi:anthranilate synthase component I [Candidatus Bathyarchaeota archaeon]|nr:anthranilate synthase component I [Candidatus Bathyarchaeota archaeon]